MHHIQFCSKIIVHTSVPTAIYADVQSYVKKIKGSNNVNVHLLPQPTVNQIVNLTALTHLCRVVHVWLF